jgi:hypothetical protein
MTPDRPDVRLLYRAGPPAHYVARLGATGSSEGWGWTEAEALTSLALAVLRDPPADAPPGVTRDLSSVIAWLASADAEARLDE